MKNNQIVFLLDDKNRDFLENFFETQIPYDANSLHIYPSGGIGYDGYYKGTDATFPNDKVLELKSLYYEKTPKERWVIELNSSNKKYIYDAYYSGLFMNLNNIFFFDGEDPDITFKKEKKSIFFNSELGTMS